jgi:mitochondrial cardiolipin hydrolase
MPKQAEWDNMLRRTLDDHRLSRSERRALGAVFADDTPTDGDLAYILNHAFDLARDELTGHQDRQVLHWLEGIVKVIRAAGPSTDREPLAKAYFTPQDDVPARIASLIRSCRRSLDICVFTITDDRIARAILETHGRNVAVRIISDDDKSFDLGSDIDRLHSEGIAVRTDRSEHHMHHKFALFDSHTLLTGSYNWTRSAANKNQENLIVVDEPRLVSAFTRTFEQLWERFG